MARRSIQRNKPPVQAKPTDPIRDQAWRAVQQFNKLTPTLNSFVRSLTGNPRLVVRAGKTTQTDNKTIWIRPPLALGEHIEHDRILCDERGPDRIALCPACARDDNVWKKLHHEVAHHLGNSMAAPDEVALQEFLKMIDEWHPKDACDHGYRMKLNAQYAENYLLMFNTFSGFMTMLNQATEDARIDSGMLNIKPGLRDQFYAYTCKTFNDGTEQDDGTHLRWYDAPINAQVIVGVMLVGEGYYLEPNWLRPEVIEILHDKELRVIISDAYSWGDVHQGAIRTIAAFKRLNELGVLVIEKCFKPAEEEPPPSLENPQDGDEGDEDDGSNGSADPEPEGEEPEEDGGDGSGSDGSGDDAGDPTGDGTAGDTADDGAFGNDFENEDDRSGGSDHEGESDDAESDEAPLSDGDDDDRQDGDAGDEHDGEQESDDSSDADDDTDSGSQGSSGSESAPADDAQAEPDDSNPEEGSAGSEGSPTEAGNAGAPGDDDAQDSTGDSDGEPEPFDHGDEPVEEDPEGEGGEEFGEPSPEDDEGTHAVGEEVWDEEHDTPELMPARSIAPEELGTTDEVEKILEALHGHEDPTVEIQGGTASDDPYDPDADEQLILAMQAINTAISQASFFDRASQEIGGQRELTYPQPQARWSNPWNRDTFSDLMPAESTIGKALLKARTVFAENKRSGYERHLRSGRVDARVLGKRAGLGDDRLFKHRHVPGKRDYIVGITVDCSGSNASGQRMERAKRAVFAKAELLNRLGVKFYITAHTGGLDRWFEQYTLARSDEMHDLMILWVKKIDEPWNDKTRERLGALRPMLENYDGHTLEFHRKLLQGRTETDKILVYYTDGAMPAANYDEEVVILQDEIATFKRQNIKLGAVGINTDSPRHYGFDTVQVDSDEDLIRVVELMERLLLK